VMPRGNKSSSWNQLGFFMCQIVSCKR